MRNTLLKILMGAIALSLPTAVLSQGYDWATHGVTLSLATAGISQPSFILPIGTTTKRFLVASTTNLYSIYEISGYTLAPIVVGQKYHSDGTVAKNTNSVMAIDNTNYFLFGTKVAGKELSRVDPVLNSNLDCWGTCDTTETRDTLVKFDDNTFVSGRYTAVRSFSTGAAIASLPATAGYYSYVLAIGPPGTMSFFSSNYAMLSVYQYSLQTTGGVAQLTMTSFITRWFLVTVNDLLYMNTQNTLIGCNTFFCDGIQASTKSLLWSISLTTLGYSSNVMLGSAQLDGNVIFTGKGSTFISIRHILEPLYNSLSIYHTEASLTNIQQAESYNDGSHVLVMSDTNVKVLYKIAACVSPCSTCSTTNPYNCITCIPGYSITTSGSTNTCTPICDPTCTACVAPGATQCTACALMHQLSGIAPAACAPFICDTSCNTCSSPLANGCLTCNPGDILAGQAPSTCGSFTCDNTCETCSGPGTSDCLTCPPMSLLLSGTAPSSCQSFTCDPSCATCSDPTPNGCNSCHALSKLFSSSPSKCIPIVCDTTCSSCIDETAYGCLTCASSLQLSGPSPNNCIPLICHPTCKTCTGFTSSECTSCYQGYQLPTTAPSNCVAVTGPSCEDQLMITLSDNSCLNCFDYQVFLANRELCTQGSTLQFIDWQAEAFWEKPIHSNLAVRIVIDDIYSNLGYEDLVPNQVLTRWTDDIAPSLSQDKIKITSNYFSIILVKAIHPADQFLFTLSNNPDVFYNIIYKNATLKVILVSKKITLEAPVDKSQGEPPSAMVRRIGDTITSISKFSTAGMAGVFLLGSTCSINVGPSFIKLFQIIEILGKFYFTPVQFSPQLDYFLSKLYGLSDVVAVDPNTILSEPADCRQNTYFKLTYLGMPKYFLRSYPVFVISYMGLSFIALLLSLITKRTSKRSQPKFEKVCKFIKSINTFIFELCYVDFAFCASFSLLGNIVQHDATHPSFIINKLMSIFIIHACAIYACRFMVSPVKLSKLSEQRRLELAKSPQANSTNKTQSDTFLYFQILLLQVGISTLQNSPRMSILLLFFQSIASLAIWSINVCKLRPSALELLQSLSFQLAIALFVTAVFVQSIGVYSPIINYFIMGLTGVCIVFQSLITFKELIGALTKCKKSKVDDKALQDIPEIISSSTNDKKVTKKSGVVLVNRKDVNQNNILPKSNNNARIRVILDKSSPKQNNSPNSTTSSKPPTVLQLDPAIPQSPSNSARKKHFLFSPTNTSRSNLIQPSPLVLKNNTSCPPEGAITGSLSPTLSPKKRILKQMQLRSMFNQLVKAQNFNAGDSSPSAI